MSCKCESENNNPGFIMGIFIGAIIAAIVAIYIYKNNKIDIFAKLKKVFEDYFKTSNSPKPTPTKPKKITVELPAKVESIDQSPISKKTQPKKMFTKPKNRS